MTNTVAPPTGKLKPEDPIVRLKPYEYVFLLKNPQKTVGILCSCLFILPIIPHIFEWLKLKKTAYKITTKRIRIEEGIFNLKINEVLLFRIVDFKIERPFLYRFFNLSDLYIYSLDISDRQTVLKGIPSADAEKLLDVLQHYVTIERQQNRADVGFPWQN